VPHASHKRVIGNTGNEIISQSDRVPGEGRVPESACPSQHSDSRRPPLAAAAPKGTDDFQPSPWCIPGGPFSQPLFGDGEVQQRWPQLSTTGLRGVLN